MRHTDSLLRLIADPDLQSIPFITVLGDPVLHNATYPMAQLSDYLGRQNGRLMRWALMQSPVVCFTAEMKWRKQMWRIQRTTPKYRR